VVVVTELDGLSKNPAPLGPAATAAIRYLETHIRTHSLSLKIQTSKGNYLSDLSVRRENYNFQSTKSSNLDDMILTIAEFQRDHFVDRSSMLRNSSGDRDLDIGAVKVLLITFDRNLRVKARGRGVDAADEKEMAAILGKG
jgi:protein SMG6